MDPQLIRYVDGELSEEEVSVFLQRIENDPELRRAFEEEERLLDLARSLPIPSASAEFTDQVMDALPDALPDARPDKFSPGDSTARETAPTAREITPRIGRRTNRRWTRWAPALSAAALVVLAFALGRVSESNAPEPGHDSHLTATGLPTFSSATRPVIRPDFAAIDTSVGERFRIVSLVYAPDSDSPAQVSVAGSFNGWNAESIPMRREGESWSAILILPPGSYEYMFIEDGSRWVTDPDAPRTREDGFGGRNAVLEVDA